MATNGLSPNPPEHARLSPSASSRWTACPGSVRMLQGMKRMTSSYAELGTAAHLLFEMCMLLGDDPEAWLGRTLNEHVVDTDMTDAVGHACDYIRGYLAQHPTAEWDTERVVNPGRIFGRDDLWGTADFTIDNRAARELTVLDYKHGAGVYVDIVDNVQLMIYMLGVLADALQAAEDRDESQFPWDKFTIVIVQPRIFVGGGPVRSRTFTLDEMATFAQRICDAAAATDDVFAPLHAGPQCRFCDASPKCPEAARHAITIAQQEFAVIAEHKPVVPHMPLRELDLDDFVYVLSQIPIIRAWCNSVEVEAELHLLRGGTLPGQKLVTGRSSYNWSKNTAEVAAVLRACGLTEDQAAPRELISPAVARKLLGGRKPKPGFNDTVLPLINKVPGRLTMVPESDPRAAVDVRTTDFQNLDHEELLT